jgi:hypothetical protein
MGPPFSASACLNNKIQSNMAKAKKKVVKKTAAKKKK